MTEYRHVCADAAGCALCNERWEQACNMIPVPVSRVLLAAGMPVEISDANAVANWLHRELWSGPPRRLQNCHELLVQAWAITDPEVDGYFHEKIKGELETHLDRCSVCEVEHSGDFCGTEPKGRASL